MGCVINCFLFLINLIVLMMGVAVITVSSVVMRSAAVYDTIIEDGVILLPMWTLIGGIFITILAIFGSCAVVKQSTCMLKCYGSLVLVILLMQLVCGVLLVAFRDKAAEYAKDRMYRTFQKYGGEDQSLSDSIDVAQHDLECCGIENYQDWFYIQNNHDVTPGCCRDSAEEDCYKNINELDPECLEEVLYTRGCYDTLIDDLADETLALGILCLVLVGIQLLCIVGACVNAAHIAKRRDGLIYQGY